MAALQQEQLSVNNYHNLGQSKKAIVEYSSPNIAKPFSIGHLRSTIIGDSVAHLLEASGYQVFRDNHLGDWGTQFGKQIVAIKKWGDEAVISSSDKPVEELVALYVKFHEEAEKDPSLEDEARAWFTKLEQGDPEARRLWQRCIDWSFVEFAKIYEYLGVSFTENNGRGFGESFFEPFLQEVIQQLITTGLAKTGEAGATLIFYPNDEFTPLMIAKKDGSTLYATRDLATDRYRRTTARYQNEDGSAPLVVNEVGSEQSFYFQQLYRAEELLGWYQKGERVHVKHGLYRFKEGKMSTRKGNVIWLQEVLDKAKDKALALSSNETIAQAVSIAALKWNDLKRKSDLNINFDWEEILNLQGNSGPYMLYSYARARSILRKAQEQKIANNGTSDFANTALEPIEKQLIMSLTNFKSSVARAASEFAPHHLCNYLFELASTFNSFYNQLPILSGGDKQGLRLQLVAHTSQVLHAGLGLLGIKTLEQM
jgi:arginyl-tRNA synthetase